MRRTALAVGVALLLNALPVRAAAPCDLPRLTTMLQDGSSDAITLNRAPDKPVVARVTRPGLEGAAFYAFVASAGDVHTSFGSKTWPKETATALQQHLDERSGTPAFLEALTPCTPDVEPSALGRTLDRAMREGRPKAAQTSNRGLTHTPSVDSPVAPPLTRAIFALLPWVWVGLLLALLLGTWAAMAATPRLDLVVVTLLALAALGLRTLVAQAGPGDIFNNMSFLYASDNPVDGFGFYGRGPPALFWLLDGLGIATTDDLLMHVNVAAGVLSVPLLFALARSLERSRTEATIAAAMLALLPLHIQFSAVYHRYILFTALSLAGLVFLCRAARLDVGRWWDVLGAASGLALAAQSRPESVAMLAVAAALVGVVAARQGVDWKKVAMVAVGVLVLAAIPVNETLSEALGSDTLQGAYVTRARPIFDPAHNVWLDTAITPWPWLLLSLVAVATPRRDDRWLVLWLVTAGLGWTWLVGSPTVTLDGIIYGRHQLGGMPFYILLAAMGTHRLLDALPLHIGVAVTSVALIAATPAIGNVTRQTTLQQEYGFYREALPKVPPNCDVVAYETPTDTGLRRPIHLGIELGIAPDRWQPAPKATGCVAYIHTSGCATRLDGEDGRRHKLCGTRLQGAFETLMERDLSVVLSTGGVYSQAKTIPVGLYLRRE